MSVEPAADEPAAAATGVKHFGTALTSGATNDGHIFLPAATAHVTVLPQPLQETELRYSGEAGGNPPKQPELFAEKKWANQIGRFFLVC